MLKIRRSVLTLMSVAVLALAALAVKVGDPAPGFAAMDSHGKHQKLADYRGKYVVLEWHNQGCRYSKKQYESGNMQRLQKEWTSKGVVWLTVISSGPGKQGFVTPEQENDYLKKMNAAPTAVLMDVTGTLGRLYDAKTTPQMFVIGPEGNLLYEGAFDEKPTSDKSDTAVAKNYVNAALTEAMSGKPVSEAVTRPYGCGVKYGKF